MKIYQVDAFTDRPFSGNSAAVCFPEKKISDQWMQDMAMEMNLSETAFLEQKMESTAPKVSAWGLRWFTPGREVDLCGHATLAASHIIFESGRVDADVELQFHTRSGILKSRWNNSMLHMDFPSRVVKPVEMPVGAVEALGVDPVYSGVYDDYILVELGSAAEVTDCSPDFGKLAGTHNGAFAITAASDDDTFDFVSRFFAPAYLIDEDPVTGSAHCMLGTYWGEKLGKKTMRAFQASKRGGVLDLIWEGDRMHLGGKAVTVFEGDILL